MLYNKNNVRKTNDKKILHKVGKQWKVVSVALLMAIGGGAAVAATNNANANADANNGVTQETQATVNSLEQGPQVGQSSAPASASSKASSASSAAPVMPKLSLNPDPSLNGNNASAELARVTQGYDNAVVKFYGNKVQSYVNFVNSNYSASANSVNSNYASASNKQSNDASSANSFSAVAAGKDWSAEVNNIASAKSGVTGSEYIDAVKNTTSSYTSAVSGSASVVSYANSVVSAAQLVSEIMSNPAIKGSYNGKYLNASIAAKFAGQTYDQASNALTNDTANSVNNQNSYYSASYASMENSANDQFALNNSSEDTSLTASLASTAFNKNYSAASSEISSYAVDFARTGHFANDVVAGDTNEEYIQASVAASLADKAYEVASGIANHAQTSVDAYNNAKANLRNDQTKSGMAKKVTAKLAEDHNAVNNLKNEVAGKPFNVAINKAAQTFGFRGAETALLMKKANAISKEFHINTVPSNINIAENGNVSVPGVIPNNGSVNFVNKLNNAKTAVNNDKSTMNAAKSQRFNVNGHPYNVATVAENLSRALSNKTNKDNALSKARKSGNNDLSPLYTLVSDTAVQQNYGSLKNSYDAVINSAKAASASDAAKVNSDSAAVNSTSAKSASAASEARALNALANANSLADVKDIVPSAGSFFGYTTKSGSNVNNTLLNAGTKSSSVSSAVSAVASLANDAGSTYTSVSNASENYTKSTDANFVLANYYANSYSAMSSSDASAFNSASAARANFYDTYAGNDFASDESQLTSAKADEPNQGALANGYARYVQIHEPHVVTVTKQLVMHANPNYNDKTDTPADAKLAVINKGTHLLVENVGFDKHGNTRLYVNYNGKKGFVTGLRNYVADSYLVPGEKYSVTFGRTANQYKGLQFNKANATKFSVKAGQTVTGTAVLNDDPHYWNGLTRLQLSNGNFVTTLDSYIKSATPLNGQSTQQSKGAYFWNGQDNTFKNVTK